MAYTKTYQVPGIYLPLFTTRYNTWSYLLWSPVIVGTILLRFRHSFETYPIGSRRTLFRLRLKSHMLSSNNRSSARYVLLVGCICCYKNHSSTETEANRTNIKTAVPIRTRKIPNICTKPLLGEMPDPFRPAVDKLFSTVLSLH